MTISASVRALAIEGQGGSACTAARPHAARSPFKGQALLQRVHVVFCWA